MLNIFLWNLALAGIVYAYIRLFDWKVKPWLEGRTSGNATLITTPHPPVAP